MQRKIIYGFGMSLDGYTARKDHSIDFLKTSKEGEALMMEFFSTIDTIIMGRKTASISMKLQKDGEMQEMPGIVNYVCSRRWKPGKRKGYEVVNGPLKSFVKKLKARPGKHIYLTGGEIARSFLQEDLVDELYIGVMPTLLGEGRPAFPAPFPQRDFELTECKGYPDGSVALRYARLRKR